MLVAVLFARPINGTRRWFGVGGFGIQPSELAKMAAILFTAMMLERRRTRINELHYSLLPIALIVGGLVTLILLEPDFGTAVSLIAVIAVMVFAAGISYRYLLGAALLALPALYVILMQADYRRRRLLTFMDPWADPLGDGFQIIQSLIAVGTGGVFGQGSDERRAEAVLPARTAHRLHLRRDLRRDRPARGHAGACCASASLPGAACAPRCARPTRSARSSRSASR